MTTTSTTTMPTFVVGGAARAATTAVIEGLRLHPDVFVTQPKEPHYFAYHGEPVAFTGPGDEEWVNRVVVTDRDRYLALFDGAASVPARGDGSVTTLYHADRAAPEIAATNPDLRVVLVLREPVERAYSSFSYLRLRGVEQEPDFLRALDLEDERRRAGWHHMWHYRAMSRYADGLRALLDTLGPDQVRVWFYEDVQAHFGRVLGEVADFLGVRPFDRAPEMPRVNASGTARLEIAQRAIRWATRHQVVRSVVKSVVGFEARERIRSSVIRSDGLPSEARTLLTPQFADDLAAVADLVTHHGLTPAAGPLPAWLDDARPNCP